MGIKRYHDRLLDQISNSMNANVCLLHREDLERLGKRATTACRFQEILEDLKDRIAQRAALRSGTRRVLPRIAMPSQAA